MNEYIIWRDSAESAIGQGTDHAYCVRCVCISVFTFNIDMLNRYNICMVVSHHIFHFISLLIPPPGEESNLNIDECPIWISKKLLDHTVQNKLNRGMLDAVVSCKGGGGS